LKGFIHFIGCIMCEYFIFEKTTFTPSNSYFIIIFF